MEVGTKIVLSAKDQASAVFNRVAKSLEPLTKGLETAKNKMDQLQKKTEGVRNVFSKVGSTVSKVGAGLSVGVSAPLGLLAKGAFDVAVGFDKSMNSVEAKVAVVGKSIDDLRGLAKKLGSETVFSAQEAANAMDILASAGWNTQQIFEGLPSILTMASASGSSIELAAKTASNMIGAFELTAADTTRISDVVATALNAFNVNMEGFADTMKYTAPIAKEFGSTIEGTAIATGLLSNIGIEGSQAGTTLRTMFTRLAAPSDAVREMFTEMGVSVSDAKGKIKPIEQVLLEIGKGMEKLSDADKLGVIKEIFGQEAISGAAGLIRAVNRGDFSKAIEQFKNVSGSSAKAAKVMTKGAVGDMANLQSAWEGFQIAIAENGLLQAFSKIAIKLTDLLSKIQNANPKFLELGVGIGMIAFAVAPVVITIGMMISSVASLIVGINGLIALKASMTVFFTTVQLGASTSALALGVLALKFAAIAAIIGSFSYITYQLTNNFDEVKFGAKSMWNSITDTFETSINTIKKMLNGFIDLLPDFAKKELGLNSVFSVKSDEQMKRERGARDLGMRNELFGSGFKPAPSNKISTLLNQAPAMVGGTTNTNVTENKVVVDFKNMPQGVKVDTKKVQDKNIGVNYGFQGATK